MAKKEEEEMKKHKEGNHLMKILSVAARKPHSH